MENSSLTQVVVRFTFRPLKTMKTALFHAKVSLVNY